MASLSSLTSFGNYHGHALAWMKTTIDPYFWQSMSIVYEVIAICSPLPFYIGIMRSPWLGLMPAGLLVTRRRALVNDVITRKSGEYGFVTATFHRCGFRRLTVRKGACRLFRLVGTSRTTLAINIMEWWPVVTPRGRRAAYTRSFR